MHIDDVVFLEVVNAHDAHARGLHGYGGASGVRDHGRIDAAVMAPQSGYCATLAEMAATYVHGFAKGHGFVDGNKRTSANVLMMFLGANGFPILLENDWADIIEKVADGTTTKQQLTAIIVTRLLGGADVSIEY